VATHDSVCVSGNKTRDMSQHSEQTMLLKYGNGLLIDWLKCHKFIIILKKIIIIIFKLCIMIIII